MFPKPRVTSQVETSQEDKQERCMQQTTTSVFTHHFSQKEVHVLATNNKSSGRLRAGHLKTAEVREAHEDPGHSHGWRTSQIQSQTDSAQGYNKEMGCNTSTSR
ncbi:hypothetical protein Tco_1273916 [Tanacetum coccineum]